VSWGTVPSLDDWEKEWERAENVKSGKRKVEMCNQSCYRWISGQRLRKFLKRIDIERQTKTFRLDSLCPTRHNKMLEKMVQNLGVTQEQLIVAVLDRVSGGC
jgi:hypothetical protein